jgi:multidrug efflux system membrane fusion protein
VADQWLERWLAVGRLAAAFLHASVLLAALALLCVGPTRAATPEASEAVPVTAEAARTQDVPVFLRGLGVVRAFYNVEVRAQVSGTLLSIPVREGQEVRKGDIVAQIDPRPYKASLDQAMAQRAEDQSQLRVARLDLQRYTDLAKRDFASRQQVDDQQGVADKLLAALQADDAAIETASINLDFCTIRSPIDGRAGFYEIDPGNLISISGQTGILSITQDRPILVVFTLPEELLLRVQQAMTEGTLPVEVYSSDEKTRLADGVLATPNNAIDTSTGTIQLKATFSNDNDRLWPGEFVNARVLVETLHQVVTVPFAAIQHGPIGMFVYVVEPGGTVREQDVEVGYEDEAIAVIAKGLREGQKVVTEGQSRLAPGIRVVSSLPAEIADTGPHQP